MGKDRIRFNLVRTSGMVGLGRASRSRRERGRERGRERRDRARARASAREDTEKDHARERESESDRARQRKRGHKTRERTQKARVLIPLGDSVLELLKELLLVAPLEHVLRHVFRLAHVLVSEIGNQI